MIRGIGPAPAKIMIVGEAPNDSDERCGEAFTGFAGQELNAMLKDAGIMRNTCFLTHVVRTKPPGGLVENLIAARKSDITSAHVYFNGKHTLPCVRDGVELLKREIEAVRPNVILAVGNLAMWALTGSWGITSWRGSILECKLELALDYTIKVIPTYHPAAIMRMWSWRQIAVHDIRRAKAESQFSGINRPEYDFIVRPVYGQVIDELTTISSKLRDGKVKLSVDLETRAGHIACIGIATSKLHAICIPLMCVERDEGYWNPEEECQIVWLLCNILTHPNVEVIGQNFLYDAQYFHRHLCFIPNVKRDTMIGQHSLFSNVQKGLDFLSSMYCQFHEYWKDEGKEWNPKVHDEDSYWTYNCKDAVITFEVDEALLQTASSLEKIWPRVKEVSDFQQSLFTPVLRTMNRGIRIDVGRRSEFARQLVEEIDKRETWIKSVTGYDLNIKSPKQMQDFFYAQLKQKPILARGKGTPTCDDEALRKIAAREPVLKPVVDRVLELRSLGVFLATFVQAPLDIDGRMRCSFKIAGTETYRFASAENAFGTGLNLQNIPKGGAVGDSGLSLPNVRSLFIPDDGYTFFDIDLASADLRIVVWEADEPEMKAMLKAGADPYTEIAKEFYHDPSITKKDPRRQTFKSFAHGTNYLGTAKGLAERLGLPVHQAEQTQRWYFNRFPKIKKWQDNLKDQVFKRRMVENVFGYRCYIFDRIEGTIFNEAAAWIPQSSVACLINRAYVSIDKNLPAVQVLLQVHDSLAGQFPTAQPDLEAKIVQSAEIPLPYTGDPLIIPVGVKTSTKSWGDCE